MTEAHINIAQVLLSTAQHRLRTALQAPSIPLLARHTRPRVHSTRRPRHHTAHPAHSTILCHLNTLLVLLQNIHLPVRRTVLQMMTVT